MTHFFSRQACLLMLLIPYITFLSNFFVRRWMQSLRHTIQTDVIAVDLWKNFERIIYNNIFEHLTTNKLISDNQSDFKPGDSCVKQLLSITHEIYHSLDNGLEVRGVFLDI